MVFPQRIKLNPNQLIKFLPKTSLVHIFVWNFFLKFKWNYCILYKSIYVLTELRNYVPSSITKISFDLEVTLLFIMTAADILLFDLIFVLGPENKDKPNIQAYQIYLWESKAPLWTQLMRFHDHFVLVINYTSFFLKLISLPDPELEAWKRPLFYWRY